METVAFVIFGLSTAFVILSMAINFLRNEDFKSAFKHSLNASAKLSDRANAYCRVVEIILVDTFPFGRYNKKTILLMNSALIAAVSALSGELNGGSEQNKRSNTIVGVMLIDKLKKSTKIQFILILCLVINFLLALLTAIEFSYFLLAIVSLMLFCIHADQQLIMYRVKKGWYGKNEYEAKEIINFILSHANKNDFNDSGGLKRVIPLPEVEAESLKNSGINGATV